MNKTYLFFIHWFLCIAISIFLGTVVNFLWSFISIPLFFTVFPVMRLNDYLTKPKEPYIDPFDYTHHPRNTGPSDFPQRFVHRLVDLNKHRNPKPFTFGRTYNKS